MIVYAQNEAPLIPDESVLQNLRGQSPLGSLENLPIIPDYERGFISDLWNLGYIPQKMSLLYPTLVVFLISLILFLVFRRKLRDKLIFFLLLIFSFLIVGPIRLIMALGINSLYGLVRIGGVVLLCFFIIRYRKTKVRLLFSSPLLLPLVLYTSSLFLSFPNVIEAASFIEALKLIVTGYIFFLIGFFSIQKIADLNLYAFYFAISAGFISIFIPLAAVFQSAYKSVLHGMYSFETYLKLLFDLQRGRITPIWDIEFFGHFILHQVLIRVGFLRRVSTILFILLWIAVFLSNTRYRVVVFLFGVLAYLVVSKRRALLRRYILPAFIFSLVYLALSNALLKVNVFERFLLQNTTTDRLPLLIRISMIEDSLAMAARFPLTGVGLGNFNEYVTFKYRYTGVPFDPFYSVVLDTYYNPHNWYLSVLAETGLLGFLSLLWLVWRMIQEDKILLCSLPPSQRLTVALFMISTWSYLLGNLVTNLHTSLPLVILFWFFRGILHRVFLEKVVIT